VTPGDREMRLAPLLYADFIKERNSSTPASRRV